MSPVVISPRTAAAVVAIAVAGATLWFAEPSWQFGAVECLLLGWVPACGTILSVYSTGKARAFWIGATLEAILPPVVYLAAFIGFDSPVFEDSVPSLGYLRVFLTNLATHFRPVLALWAFAPIVGLLCISTHWFLVREPEPTE